MLKKPNNCNIVYAMLPANILDDLEVTDLYSCLGFICSGFRNYRGKSRITVKEPGLGQSRITI